MSRLKYAEIQKESRLIVFRASRPRDREGASDGGPSAGTSKKNVNTLIDEEKSGSTGMWSPASRCQLVSDATKEMRCKVDKDRVDHLFGAAVSAAQPDVSVYLTQPKR